MVKFIEIGKEQHRRLMMLKASKMIKTQSDTVEFLLDFYDNKQQEAKERLNHTH